MKIRSLLYKKRFFIIIKCLAIKLILSQCGYQPSTIFSQNKTNTTDCEKLTVLLYSYDPVNIVTRTIKNELTLNNVIVFNDLYDKIQMNQKLSIPYLNIMDASKKHIIVSVFPDGITSEYKIILKLKVLFYIPKKEINYPVNTYVCRTLIHHPRQALSNLIQDNEIINEMYQEIAQKIVQQFLIQLNN